MEGTRRGQVGQAEDCRGRTGEEVGWDGAGARRQPPSPHCPAVCPAGSPPMPEHTRLPHPSLYAFIGRGHVPSVHSLFGYPEAIS